ncbi:MAG TPA: potassium-transporting ATPase subunit KdpA [Alphaproteobacteria bacterium]|nr:potassium-transporting ATPase subunit KdpA [Alphaproteobacteria bacterium]
MTVDGLAQIALYFALIVLVTKPLGGYMTRVFAGERTFLAPVLRPIERGFYRLAGVDPEQDQHWLTYAAAMLLFNFAGFLLVYLLERVQAYLPLNPQGMANVSPDLAFNTAISFATNTNWQNYGGEGTMSYLTQMAALTVQNFCSAATGIVLAIALVRGFARRSAKGIGNFWADVTRCTFYILMPISVVAALVLVWQGVPQTLGAYVDATTLEGAKQTIALGPVASQIAIKMLGTNGGGFFNANAAHPFENPTPLANYVQMILMIAISAALTNVFGRMVGNQKQGWALFGAMAILSVAGVLVLYHAEAAGNPAFAHFGVDQTPSLEQAGGNMEGKEVRFGIADTALFATLTTDASCGAVNGMHDSFTPIGGLVPLVNIELGEVIWGGVGSGLYGMFVFAIVTLFIAGLMVGRTPEYVGKKLESREVKMTMLAFLVLPLSILGFTALASVLPAGLAGIANNGPHGFTEILYAYSSTTGNNGSAFAGLNGNTMFYNLTLAAAMLIGRFVMVVPLLAVAGSLAAKKIVPPSAGTFPTDNGLFVALLVGVILITVGLTYFAALSLGPGIEQIFMNSGKLF